MISVCAKLLWHCRCMSRVLGDRLRARALRLQGAKLGAKARVGTRVIVDRPWCLEAGDRVFIEPNCYVKSVSDEATINLGAYAFLGFGAAIDCMVRVDVGDHTLIAPRCFIVDHNHGIATDRRIDEQPCEGAAILMCGWGQEWLSCRASPSGMGP